MRNIIVVSINKDLAISIGARIAKILSLSIIDADLNLDDRLIGSLDFPIDLADDIMRNSENQMLTTLSRKNDCVICMSDEMFLSNENHKIFNKSLKIHIKTYKNERIIEGVQNLLEKYCDVTLIDENIDLDRLITLLRG